MREPSTLRMMEKEELNSFKELTKVENRKLLDAVIRQYCSIGMCNYNTILMMYNDKIKHLKKSWRGRLGRQNITRPTTSCNAKKALHWTAYAPAVCIGGAKLRAIKHA